MNANQDWQVWSMGFDQQTQMMNRAWTQKTWQYQDQMDSLNFGWQMEDMDEAIRTSSGRQRAQLVKQRDRAVLTHNLNGQQTEDARSQQEEMWEREDERYKKQTEYANTLMALDKQSFDLSKIPTGSLLQGRPGRTGTQVPGIPEAEEATGPDGKTGTRVPVQQLQLQKESAGIQAAAAAESQDIRREHGDSSEAVSSCRQVFQRWIENDPKKLSRPRGFCQEPGRHESQEASPT